MTEPAGAGLGGVRAVLQAGGRGERLRAAAGGLPKPLVPVAGVPMAERLLRQIAAAGVRDVTVVTGWEGGAVEAHLGAVRGLPADLSLRFLREEEPRGNAGALAALPREGGDVLLAFADLVTDLDFAALLSVHRSRAADVTLASHHESVRLRLGELLAGDDGRVEGYLEKPVKRFLICSGIALVRPHVLDVLPPGGSAGLVDLVQAAVARGHAVFHWTHGAFWMDVNTPEDLQAAGRALAAWAPALR